MAGGGGLSVQSYSIIPSGSALTVRNNSATNTIPDTYALGIRDEQLTPGRLTLKTVMASNRSAAAISGMLVEDWSTLANTSAAYVIRSGLNVTEGVTPHYPGRHRAEVRGWNVAHGSGHLGSQWDGGGTSRVHLD